MLAVFYNAPQRFGATRRAGFLAQNLI